MNTVARIGLVASGFSLVMGMALGAAPVGRAAPAAQGCAPAWQVDFGPTPGTRNALAAVGPNDIWAVGSRSEQNGRTLIEHWDGRAWQQVPSPSQAPTQHTLAAVTAVSAYDVWAVGWYKGSSFWMNGPRRATIPLVEHWDGTRWAMVALPAALNYGYLTGVAASGPSDVWAVGYRDPGDSGYSTPLVLHWDGTTWTAPTLPNAGTLSQKLNAVTALAPDNVWAVGSHQGTGDLILHWDGKTWQLVPGAAGSPAPLTSASPIRSLQALAVGGPGEIWAAGQVYTHTGNATQDTARLLVERWDGTRWQDLPSPVAGPGFNPAPTGIVRLSANDVWVAARYQSVSGGPGSSAVLHWDGATWTRVPELEGPTLSALAAVAADDIWATGGTQYAHYRRPCAPTPAPNPVVLWNPTAPLADPHDPPVRYFAETGHTLRGLFRTYWEQHGGLAQFGYPLTEEFQERNSTDGQVYTVQYFERNRFEYHPELPEAFHVSLGLLGNTMILGREMDGPFQSYHRPGAPPSTDGIAPEFLAYWQSHGGLPVYGYPISEPFTETSPTDGKPYLVQYFERNRFEYHPELPEVFHVSLGLLGVQLVQLQGWIP